MTSSSTKFFFLRDKLRTPVGCIATRWTPGGRDNGVLLVGVSSWNKSDEFDRAEAKRVAVDRLNEGRWIYTADWLRSRNTKREILSLVSGTKMDPRSGRHILPPYPVSGRVIMAARLWLRNYNPERRRLARDLAAAQHRILARIEAAMRSSCAHMDAMGLHCSDPRPEVDFYGEGI